MSPTSLRQHSIALALFVVAGACSRTQSQPKIPLGQAAAESSGPRAGLPPEAVTALDLGNAEFRLGNYDKALASYRDAVKAAPENAAPYFGIYMTAKKLGNTKLADSATAAIAARNGSNLMLSDSAMRALHETKVK